MATASLIVGLKGAGSKVAFQLQARVDATNLAVLGTVILSPTFVGNYDLVMGSSSGDTMDDSSAIWTLTNDPLLSTNEPWVQVHDGANGRWSIPDHGAPSDQRLVSPPLQVSTTGSFGFTLRHLYSIETDPTNYYDGGVIEITTNDGKTWTDIGTTLSSNGYNGVLWALNDVRPNRRAFVGTSTGYPNYLTTTADLGATYRGKTVKLRFRVGTDPAVGGPGWDIDDLQLSGIDNLPFPSRRAGTNCIGTP